LIVVGGAALTVFIVYGMNLRRTRRLYANAQDLHGSARWASPPDIKETGLLDNEQGVYVAGWYNQRVGRLQ